MRPVTPNQVKTLRFISEFQSERGYGPTQREIAEHFGITNNAARERVQALSARELLLRTSFVARALSLTHAGKKLLRDA